MRKNQRLNLSHIDDVVDGIMQAIKIENGKNYQEFQIRAPESITLKQLVELIEKYRNLTIPVAYGKIKDRRQITDLWECAESIPEFMPKRNIFEYLNRIN